MDRDLYRELKRLLDPLYRALSLVASKAVVELVKDSIGLQGLQVAVLSDEVGDEDTEHMQPGGISHVPLAGSEGVFLTIGGVRDDGVMICVSHRAHRPKNMQPGETALYNDGDHKSTIKLLQDGSVVTTSGGSAPSTITMAANGAITVTSGDGQPINLNGLEIDSDGNLSTPGNVEAGGNVEATGNVTGAEVSNATLALGTHVHQVPPPIGAPTGPGQSPPPPP